MKPRLFPSDAVSFKNMGYGEIDAISCIVTESLNGEYDLHMTMLNTDRNFPNIMVGNIIAVKPNGTDPIQAFCIEEIGKAINGEVEIYATHIAQFRSKLIPVANYTATSLSDAIDKAFTNSLESNPFTFTTDKTVATSYTLNAPRSFRELMGGKEGSLLDIYGGEYYFDNFNIQLLLHRGQDNGVRIFYGKNMTDFNANDMFSWNDSATGVLPYWYSEEDGLVVGSIQYSPYESQYKYKRTIVKDYTEDFEEKPTSSDLNDAASAWISNKGLETQNISVAFDDLATENNGKMVMLGDTVHIINTRYNVNYTSRIVKTEFNVLLEKYDYIEVGTLSQTINEAISETVDEKPSQNSLTSIPYYMAQGSQSSVTLQAGAYRQTTLDTVLSSNGSGFSFSNGGIKVADAGKYMICGSVYIGSAANARNFGTYITKGSTFSSSTEIQNCFLPKPNTVGHSGCVPTGMKVFDLNADDTIFLAARTSGGDNGTQYPNNVSTYLLIVKIG